MVGGFTMPFECLVFCLYAKHAGIFGKHVMSHDSTHFSHTAYYTEMHNWVEFRIVCLLLYAERL